MPRAPDAPAVVELTADWLAVHNPAGWLTIAGRPGDAPAPILKEWARERYGDIWIVHRLDRETSGVLLLARTASAHRNANHWFQTHQIRKLYDCLAVGVLLAPVVRLNTPVEGLPAVTQVGVVEAYLEGFLGRVRPLTGRRHQIRKQLSQAGFPLWGDPTYGGPRSVRLGGKPMAVTRVALHATSLDLPDGKRFETPWSDDFRGWVEALRTLGTPRA